MLDAAVPVLLHEADTGPGHLAEWLDGAGLPWQLIDARAEPMPEPGRYRMIAVLGSAASVFDPAESWIAPELAFVRASAVAGTPVLGLCFGAQLLAAALGGEVRRMAGTERGWVDVAGEAPYGGIWFDWHQDEIVAPPGATELARTSAGLHAFSVGPHLGLQFHPEVTPDHVDDWLATSSAEAPLVGDRGEPDRMRADSRRFADDARVRALALFDEFARGASAV